MLKPNMYVRTKYGIFKIRKITKDLAYRKHEKRVIELDRNIPECHYRFLFYKDESIFKGAKFKDNIIDLIEAGDYVNGEKVYEKNGHLFIGNWWPENINIKSIVTREQFEQMQYKVGD